MMNFLEGGSPLFSTLKAHQKKHNAILKDIKEDNQTGKHFVVLGFEKETDYDDYIKANDIHDFDEKLTVALSSREICDEFNINTDELDEARKRNLTVAKDCMPQFYKAINHAEEYKAVLYTIEKQGKDGKLCVRLVFRSRLEFKRTKQLFFAKKTQYESNEENLSIWLSHYKSCELFDGKSKKLKEAFDVKHVLQEDNLVLRLNSYANLHGANLASIKKDPKTGLHITKLIFKDEGRYRDFVEKVNKGCALDRKALTVRLNSYRSYALFDGDVKRLACAREMHYLRKNHKGQLLLFKQGFSKANQYAQKHNAILKRTVKADETGECCVVLRFKEKKDYSEHFLAAHGYSLDEKTCTITLSHGRSVKLLNTNSKNSAQAWDDYSELKKEKKLFFKAINHAKKHRAILLDIVKNQEKYRVILSFSNENDFDDYIKWFNERNPEYALMKDNFTEQGKTIKLSYYKSCELFERNSDKNEDREKLGKKRLKQAFKKRSLLDEDANRLLLRLDAYEKKYKLTLNAININNKGLCLVLTFKQKHDCEQYMQAVLGRNFSFDKKDLTITLSPKKSSDLFNVDNKHVEYAFELNYIINHGRLGPFWKGVKDKIRSENHGYTLYNIVKDVSSKKSYFYFDILKSKPAEKYCVVIQFLLEGKVNTLMLPYNKSLALFDKDNDKLRMAAAIFQFYRYYKLKRLLVEPSAPVPSINSFTDLVLDSCFWTIAYVQLAVLALYDEEDEEKKEIIYSPLHCIGYLIIWGALGREQKEKAAERLVKINERIPEAQRIKMRAQNLIAGLDRLIKQINWKLLLSRRFAQKTVDLTITIALNGKNAFLKRLEGNILKAIFQDNSVVNIKKVAISGCGFDVTTKFVKQNFAQGFFQYTKKEDIPYWVVPPSRRCFSKKMKARIQKMEVGEEVTIGGIKIRKMAKQANNDSLDDRAISLYIKIPRNSNYGGAVENESRGGIYESFVGPNMLGSKVIRSPLIWRKEEAGLSEKSAKPSALAMKKNKPQEISMPVAEIYVEEMYGVLLGTYTGFNLYNEGKYSNKYSKKLKDGEQDCTIRLYDQSGACLSLSPHPLSGMEIMAAIKSKDKDSFNKESQYATNYAVCRYVTLLVGFVQASIGKSRYFPADLFRCLMSYWKGSIVISGEPDFYVDVACFLDEKKKWVNKEDENLYFSLRNKQCYNESRRNEMERDINGYANYVARKANAETVKAGKCFMRLVDCKLVKDKCKEQLGLK